MILGAQIGRTTCGWALLDDVTCSFVDLGVVVIKPVDVAVTLERVRRAHGQAKVLAAKASGCSTIVVERMSRTIDEHTISIAMAWGVIVGIGALVDPVPALLTIAQDRWQREVLPAAGTQVDHDELARAAGAHILARHPRAARALERMPHAQRPAAIGAAMLALVGALRPERCTRVSQ